ncbi:hypothetical protein [Empedobacter sp.]|uniref:hypothetical protein n=1 Tax=Empedobacter sp. TaxID=1927715 RepID=UPI0028AE3BE5|nr:hypothetical protein [Empedobacter sp.]
MNKFFFKYLLFFISCLFIANSCTNDDQLIEVQTKNNEVKNKFSVFYKNNNTQARGGDLSINYPKGFAILLQKYDSVQQTNLSGLVNTSNEIIWDRNLRQNFIKNASEPYVETRIFSQTMVNNKGDISLIFPKIFNNQVIDLIVAELHDEETQVHFYILDENSILYQSSIQLFQERFENTFLKKNAKSANGGFDCGYGTLPPCNLDGPIIVGGGDSGGGFCCWGGGNGGEIGGGGCPKYDMCVVPDTGGADPGNPNENTNNDSPCEKAKSIGKNNKTIDLMKNNLKPKTSDNKEYGYVLVEENNIIHEFPVEGKTNDKGIDLYINGKIDGFIHSHYTGLLSVFSLDDIFGIAFLYKNGNIYNTSTFALGIVTASNTQYILVIDNISKFTSFTESIMIDNQINETALSDYEYFFKNMYSITPENNLSTNENNFIDFLEKSNTGLKVLKGSEDFKNWNLLNKNSSGDIIEQYCP